MGSSPGSTSSGCVPLSKLFNSLLPFPSQVKLKVPAKPQVPRVLMCDVLYLQWQSAHGERCGVGITPCCSPGTDSSTLPSPRDLFLDNHTPLLRPGPPCGLGPKRNLATILNLCFSFTSTLNTNSAHFCLLLIAWICSIFSIIAGSYCLFPELLQHTPTLSSLLLYSRYSQPQPQQSPKVCHLLKSLCRQCYQGAGPYPRLVHKALASCSSVSRPHLTHLFSQTEETIFHGLVASECVF